MEFYSLWERQVFELGAEQGIDIKRLVDPQVLLIHYLDRLSAFGALEEIKKMMVRVSAIEKANKYTKSIETIVSYLKQFSKDLKSQAPEYDELEDQSDAGLLITAISSIEDAIESLESILK